MPFPAIQEAAPDTPFLNARVDTYAMLAALLNRPPDADLLLQLQAVELHASMPERLVAAWTALREGARACASATVEKEFQALFVGLGQGEVVPYASWYREGLLMARPLARLRQDLSQMGIVRRPHFPEAEDHAGLLCETMALLGSRRTLPVRLYSGFFDEHVASWMFSFFSDVHKAPSARFYGTVAGLGTALLHLEQSYLAAQECGARH